MTKQNGIIKNVNPIRKSGLIISKNEIYFFKWRDVNVENDNIKLNRGVRFAIELPMREHLLLQAIDIDFIDTKYVFVKKEMC